MKKIKQQFYLMLVIIFVVTAVITTCGRKGPDAPPDTTPPTVTITSPYYGEQNVPLNIGTITATFSEEMDASTINNQTISVMMTTSTGSSITPVDGSVSYSKRSAVFTPASELSPNSPYTLTIGVGVKDLSGNALVTPFFCTFATGITRNMYTVTPVVQGNGQILPNTAQQVNYNDTVTFAVTPDTGHHIASVTGCGAGTLEGTTYTTAPVTANCTVTAIFESDSQTTTHTITATAGENGSIIPLMVNVNHGETASFEVSANTGFHASVTGCGGTLFGSIYTTGAIMADCSVEASFAINPAIMFKIEVHAGDHGTITPGTIELPQGADQSFTIKPEDGYSISDVKVDGSSVDPVTSYTFHDVRENHKISASFTRIRHIITSTAGENGSISPSGLVAVDYGSDKSFKIEAVSGFFISDVQVDNTSVGPVPSYTFPNVIADHTISASFAGTTQTIIATAGLNGYISPSGTVAVIHGADQPFAIIPDPAWSIDDVFVDGSSIGPVPSYTFPNVIADHTINAVFVETVPDD